jgi:hypothetical protein
MLTLALKVSISIFTISTCPFTAASCSRALPVCTPNHKRNHKHQLRYIDFPQRFRRDSIDCLSLILQRLQVHVHDSNPLNEQQ